MVPSIRAASAGVKCRRTRIVAARSSCYGPVALPLEVETGVATVTDAWGRMTSDSPESRSAEGAETSKRGQDVKDTSP